jgi:MFS family permease
VGVVPNYSPFLMGTNTGTERATDSGAAAAAPSSRVFWTYWGAGTVSSVGSAVTSVALPLTAVVVLHASALEVGLLAAASYAAWLVIGLPAGVVVGRLPLRGTQLAMDLVRAVAVATVPVAWGLDALTLGHLVAVALAVSFASVLFEVGNMSFLPALVPKAELTSRNSLMSGTHATVQLGGPALGGVLVQALGAVPTLLVDAGSYLVSAVLIRRLPDRRVPVPPEPGSMRSMIRDGWHFVVRHPVMGPCMWEATAVNFVCGALIALSPVYLVRELGAPAGLVGLLIASEGIGSLLGAALAPRLTRQVGSGRVTLLSGLAGAGAALLLPVGTGAAGMVAFACGNAGFAAGVVVGSITTRTLRQRVTPPELLTRVMATVRFVSWGAIPFGALAAGVLASATGVRTALWCTAVATFVPVLILWTSPVRGLRDLEGESSGQRSR